jgi:release factor glutamine methyltransferase
MVYEPREDSYLLQKWVKRYAQGHVLDMGTGTGIQAITAKERTDKVIAVDIDGRAVSILKLKHPEIESHQSDLFSLYSRKPRKFDTIIFNPPYLPDDKRARDRALDGGRKGYEVLARFIENLGDHLHFGGCALIVFSSHTGKKKIDDCIQQNLLKAELLEKKRIFFEELYVYLIRKSKLLDKLQDIGLSGLRYFTHGKRGVLYTASYRNRKVVAKTKRPESKAEGRIANESLWLKRLNRHGIGPRHLFSSRDFVVYVFVKGDFIIPYIEKASKRDTVRVLTDVFTQLHTLDTLKVDKEEMHHPLKHIIIDKKPVLIDFERCHQTG